MSLLTLVIGASTAIGLSYFSADLYRNRRRTTEKPATTTDLTCYEVGVLDGNDLQSAGDAVGHAGHEIAAASSKCVEGNIGHCVEVIAHVIAHH
ncbi:hypothetical protein [Nodosilinea sp. E11]|uniref:hypothetical protein n=1 Tax=Nodosilinea sp. E11 TaxID=3037479 RepID=UPI0029345B36|nr:hypothetical protein [Nodosilinea sp. E11]WOD37273.1 hypothetical protein RRF56_01495 [Nodosilinea sp. E11]